MKDLTLLIVTVALVSCGAKSSDEQRVRDVVAAMETAAESRDASDVLEHVAQNYEDAQGFDRAQLTNFLRGYFLAHPRIELLVVFESLYFPADGLAHAIISVANLAPGDADHERFKVEFRREGDAWQLSRADRLQP
ncbi:MAG TPA: hypothetical protein VFO82_15915 [Steroidobacteraceae bacterium]|nr:hypothetical protein [Steroidobacteraceae bacterium]